MAQKQTYVPLKKEVYQSFGSKINAASMDDRFLIGMIYIYSISTDRVTRFVPPRFTFNKLHLGL